MQTVSVLHMAQYVSIVNIFQHSVLLATRRRRDGRVEEIKLSRSSLVRFWSADLYGKDKVQELIEISKFETLRLGHLQRRTTMKPFESRCPPK